MSRRVKFELIAIASLASFLIITTGCTRRDSREAVLRDNLFTLRAVIDQFTLDKRRAPQSLDDLVQSGYLKEIPVDPFTESRNTWQVTQEQAMQSVDPSHIGVTDVHSGAKGTGSDGRPYSEW